MNNSWRQTGRLRARRGLLNPVAVGFETTVKQVTDFVLAPAESLGFTVSPNFGERKASNRLEKARSIYETSLTNALPRYVPAAARRSSQSRSSGLVIGTDYPERGHRLTDLRGFVVCRRSRLSPATDSIASDAHGRERGTSVANSGLDLVLIPTIPIVEAAIATVLTRSINVAVNPYTVYSELPSSLESLEDRSFRSPSSPVRWPAPSCSRRR